MKKLETNEYAPYFKPYIDQVLHNDKNIIENLEDSLHEAIHTLKDIGDEKQLYQYADDKWTIKEIVQHIIDAERVFNYRALRFARNDKTELSSFDENSYVDASNVNHRDFKNLLEELSVIRKSTILMYQGFSDKNLLLKGKASGAFVSVRALGYITSGHLLHHLQVIKSRYL